MYRGNRENSGKRGGLRRGINALQCGGSVLRSQRASEATSHGLRHQQIPLGAFTAFANTAVGPERCRSHADMAGTIRGARGALEGGRGEADSGIEGGL
jgi:hypothetical protein